MRLATYVRRSPHGIYYLRVVIPPSIRAKLAGRRELRRSLGTRDPRTARLWAYGLATVVSQWIHEAKHMAAPDVATLLARLRSNSAPKYEIDLRRGLFRSDPSVPGDHEAMLAAIQALGLNGPHGPSILAAAGAASAQPLDMPQQDESRLLSVVAQEFLADQFQRTQNPKTQADYGATLAAFLNAIGDRPVATISADDVTRFLTVSTSQGLKPKTLKKRISSLHTVLRFAQALAYFPADRQLPTTPVTQQMKRQPTKRTRRLPFESQDLQLIFREDAYISRNAKRPHWFWLPVLGLFTGARIEELCQLRLSDIRRDAESGIWYFDFNEHEGKTLKNEASIRRVPLHDTLIDLGLLKYRNAVAKDRFDDDRLFPYLPVTKFGHRSDSASKHFMRYLREIGVTDRRKVFHSFRHTVGTTLRTAGVSAEIRHRLLGHAIGDGEHATYMHADIPITKLYIDGISRLQYASVSLDFLKYDPFQVRGWVVAQRFKSAPSDLRGLLRDGISMKSALTAEEQ